MASKLPEGAPRKRVVSAFAKLGAVILRKDDYVSLQMKNPLGATNVTFSGHPIISRPTLFHVLRGLGISEREFMKSYDETS